MSERLPAMLHELRLPGLAAALEVRLHEAASHQLNHAEFLELALQDELYARQERRIERRVKQAAFRDLKPLDAFDWSFNPALPKKQILELATCRFIRETRDVLLIGPPGTGKSFLAQAIGYQAIKQNLTVVKHAPWIIERANLTLPAVQTAIDAIRKGKRRPSTHSPQRELPLK